jgi:predicted enzyme related to lactoylglutathione lyase
MKPHYFREEIGYVKGPSRGVRIFAGREGGTTFYFVTDGIDEALRRAKQAAGEQRRQDRWRCVDRALVSPD